MFVQCAKQTAYCHVQTACRGIPSILYEGNEFVPAFDCSEHNGRATTVGGICRTALPYKLFFTLEIQTSIRWYRG